MNRLISSLSKINKSLFEQKTSSLSLRQNFIWSFAGNTIYACCQWGVLIVLAKLGSAQMIGQFSLGLALAAPIFMLTNLQLRGVQATDAKGQYEFSDYLGLRLIAALLSLIIIIGIATLSTYHRVTTTVIIIIACAKAFESISDVFYGYLQQNEQMDRIAKSMILKGVLTLIVLGIAVYWTKNIIAGVLGLTIVWAMLLFYDVGSSFLVLKKKSLSEVKYNNKYLFTTYILPKWNIGQLFDLAKLSFPLGIVMMLASLNANIPRYFIENLLGEKDLGIFSAMAYLMIAGNTVVGALGQSATPRLAIQYSKKNKKEYIRLVAILLGFGLLLGIMGIILSLVAGRQILTFLYRPEYAEHYDVFLLLMVAAGISYVTSVLGYGMTAARQFRVQVPLVILATIVTVLSCIHLVGHRGLRGAALSVVISGLVQCLGNSVILWYVIRKYGK